MPTRKRPKTSRSYFISRYRPDSPFVFTGEHASGYIPSEYKNLGLSKKDLRNSKDWFDKGSKELLRELARQFGASMLESGVSRLVIDYNRRLNAKPREVNAFHSSPLKTKLLVEKNGEDVIVPIPSNAGEEKAVRRKERARYNRYVKPYASKGFSIVRQLKKKHGTVYVVQVHSFEPRYNGDVRLVDIEVLSFNVRPESARRARRIVAAMRKNTSLVIAHNKPWNMASVDGGVFKDLQKDKKVVLVPFDVNNRNLRSRASVRRIAAVISRALMDVFDMPLTRFRRRV